MSHHHQTPAELQNIPPKERFINRETSWLAFNARVLEEAINPHVPLLERVNYLSISASNLDEFYMVRVAGLRDHMTSQVQHLSDDGLTPEQQMKKIHNVAVKLIHDQQLCWIKLRKEMKDAKIVIINPDDIGPEDREWLEEYFIQNIFPVLTPIAIDPAHPFPFLPNLGIAQVFQLSVGKDKEQIAVLPLPATLSRFVRLPGKSHRYLLLEACIELFLDKIFPGITLLDSGIFRIVRDSDVEIEGEAQQDLMRYFERALKHRKRGEVIRIKVNAAMSPGLLQFVMSQLGAMEEDVIAVDGMLDLASVKELYAINKPDLKFPPFKARFPERIGDFGGDCFAAIAAKDILVHHPYESFDVVVQFLRQAAADPSVVSIKQTLYRTSTDSPIVKALIEAAEAGKSVTALVELKARFDEEANIRWARDMERVGIQVIYGFTRLKTHAKVSLVVRRMDGRLKSYVHYGTGNYHPTTARHYTDLSYFTCDPDLCMDAAYFFNFVTGYAAPKNIKKLAVAPRTLREKTMALIGDEIRHAEAGRPASIWAKMNALVDPEIIDALYLASRKGVKIELVVRGICCLRPGVKGLSETIRVKSIVGRFLEHSRIFCFGNGEPMPSKNAKVFISSADWMPRNFDWRVEVMVPIENPTVHEQIIGQIMMANLKDERQTWFLKEEGGYARLTTSPGAFSANDYFMHNPSLSGRGKALKKAKVQMALPQKPKPAKPKKK